MGILLRMLGKSPYSRYRGRFVQFWYGQNARGSGHGMRVECAIIYLTHPGRGAHDYGVYPSRCARDSIGGAISLWSLLQMEPFNAHILCAFVRDLHGFERDAQTTQGNVTDVDMATLTPILVMCDHVTEFFYLPATSARKDRAEAAIDGHCSYSELQRQLTALRETMEDELASRMAIFLPAKRATFFLSGERLLGERVLTGFPVLASDI